MKLKYILFTIFGFALAVTASISLAQSIPTLDQFVATTTPAAITQRTYGKAIKVTGLSDGCLGLSSALIVSSGSPCGSGGGGVTSIDTNNGLTGGPITTTGTIGIDSSSLSSDVLTIWDGSKLVSGPGASDLDPSTGTTGYMIYLTSCGCIRNRAISSTDSNIGVANGDGGSVFGTKLTFNHTYPGNTSLSTLGTVTTGTWNAGDVTSSGNVTANGGFVVANNFGFQFGLTTLYNQDKRGGIMFSTAPSVGSVEAARFTSTGRFGIGTSTPRGWLSVTLPGADSTTTPIFLASHGTSAGATTTDFMISNLGNVGIATTSPGSIFSVKNVTNFTAATSTFYGSGGLNLTSGCYAIAGTCIGSGGSGSGTVNSGTTNQAAYYPSNGTAVSGSNTLTIDESNGFVGINKTNPTDDFDVGNIDNDNGLVKFATNGFLTQQGDLGNLSSGGVFTVDGGNGTMSFNTSGIGGSNPSLTANGTGIGANDSNPLFDIGLGGDTTRTISLERESASTSPGQILQVKAGSAKSGATNTNGGNLNLYSGVSTGSGGSDVNILVSGAGTTGTADRTPFVRQTWYGNELFGSYLSKIFNDDGSLAVMFGGAANNQYIQLSGAIVDQVISGIAYYGSGSSGTYFGSNGHPVGIGIDPTSAIANLYISTSATNQKSVVIRNIAGQTASPFEIQNSVGGFLAGLSAGGNWGIGTSTPYATSSIQSNSSVGDAFAIATSSGNTIRGEDNDGHMFTSGPAPVISSCGTGTGTVVGDDQGGTITTAAAATSCTMTFAKAYRGNPVCTVTDNSLVGFADVSSVSTSAATFGISSALTGGNLYYSCSYHR